MNHQEAIADLAYRLWMERGRPHGTHEEDWLEAERQLAQQPASKAHQGQSEKNIDSSIEATFPASDPPASHLPDVPPANAADRWNAAAAAKSSKPARPAPRKDSPRH